MKSLFSVLIALAIIVSSTPAQAAPRAKHVFIISFDGGKPEVMKRSPMPTLFGMVNSGAATWNAQTVFPSITLVSHTSMLTGLQPAKHHISWNDWIPSRGIIKVPTVFSLAHQKGYKTALFAGKPKFQHLNISGSLDRFDIPDYNCDVVAAKAARYIVAQKPNLCFIHFANSDGAGHYYGWGTPQQVRAFADEDAALKMVRDAVKRAGIEKESVFILSADHGGHARTHGTNSPEDMTIPWIVWGKGVKSKFTISSPVSTYDTTATALWLLDVPLPKNLDGKPVISAFKPLP